MSRGGGYRHHRRPGHDNKDKGFQVPSQVDEDPPDSPHEEIAPYNPAHTPSSSNYKARIVESSFNLKTSTELLKVLNRIWILEEQHASNMSLVNALKRELDHSRARIKELTREKQTNRHEMEELMQQSLHRKLARELSNLKTSFSSALKEFEREKKARILLEDLCDEFAKGIRDYEQEVRSLKHKPEKERAHRESPDRLILHLSEAWIDERMQMKLTEPQYDLAEKNTIVDKLSLEIETFLRAKHSVGLLNGKQSNGISKHNGNDASESHLKEVKPNPKQKKKALSREILKGQQGSQMQFEYGENGHKRPGAGNFTRTVSVKMILVPGQHFRVMLVQCNHGKSRFTAPDIEVSETSSRWPQGLKRTHFEGEATRSEVRGPAFALEGIQRRFIG
ncbi:myosin heavy chain-like protein [Actinidia rufa]|uniref:Myosin heavy chain-like protein n=1 Tax=Actinidia rufa TaxID=165716 RepID=A0A7J0F0Y5_9ERIC|nr:myosin heavy chain-like protein [Actinidia rufa]